MLGPDNAIWDDGEWVGWGEIEEQIQYKEWGAKYPNADRSLIPIFEDLLGVAEEYNRVTGSHLQVYGDIGDDFVEVKTITPFKANDYVEVKASGNFSKLLVVKINQDFELSCRMVARKDLPKAKGGKHRINWLEIA